MGRNFDDYLGTGPSQGLKIRGGLVVMGGDYVPPLVEIGLTDLPKTGGGAKAPPAPPLATALGDNVPSPVVIG